MPKVWPIPPALTVYDAVLGDVPVNRVRAGLPVASVGQWADHAKVANWLLGHGVQVASFPPHVSIVEDLSIAPGASRYYGQILVSYDTDEEHKYCWSICLRPVERGLAHGYFENENGDLLGLWSVENRDLEAGKIFRVVSTPGAPADDVIQIVVFNSADSQINVSLVGAQCFEIPRLEVAAAIESVPEFSLDSRQPIYDDADATSLQSVLACLARAEQTTRRALLYHMVQPVTGSTVVADYQQYTNGAFPDDEQVNAYAPILPRGLRGEVTRTLSYVLIAGVVGSAAQTGEVRVRLLDQIGIATTDSDTRTVTWATGDGSTLITGTLECRPEDVGNLPIDEGDPTVGAGWPGGAGGVPDVVEINARVVTATSIYVVYFAIYEAY